MNIANKLYTLLGVLVIASATALWGYGKGVTVGEAEEAQRNKAAAEQLEREIKAKNQQLDELTLTASKEAQQAETKIQIVYRDKVKEVTKYVKQNPTESAAPIGAEWVRLHDNFATQGRAEASAPAHGVVEARSGVTKADAIAVVGDNYRLYHECSDRLTRLQNFYAKQMDIVNGQTP